MLRRTTGLPEATGAILGHLFEIGVYRDVPRQIMRSLGRLVGASFRLGARLVGPALLFIVPCLAVLIPLQACEGSRPLAPGERCLVSLQLEGGQDVTKVDLLLPTGLSLTAPPVRIPGRGEIDWRVQADRSGSYTLEAAGASKQIRVGQGFPLLRRSRTRDWYGAWLTPGEPNLDQTSSVKEFRVDYPQRIYQLGNHSASWPVVFLLALIGFSTLAVSIRFPPSPPSRGESILPAARPRATHQPRTPRSVR